jgi:hypothetical protein
VVVATNPQFTSPIHEVDLHDDAGTPPIAWQYLVPTAPVPGTVYYWKAVNRFVQPGGGTELVNGTFFTGGSYQVGPANLGPPSGTVRTNGTSFNLQADVPSSATGAIFTICAGPPPCTTPVDTSGTIAKVGSTCTYATPTLAAGRYTWRVTSLGEAGYAEAGFYVDGAPTSPTSAPELYLQRLTVSSFAPWVDFYWWDPSQPETRFTPPNRLVGPPAFDTVVWYDLPQVEWTACTQFGTPGDLATQGACTATQTYRVF